MSNEVVVRSSGAPLQRLGRALVLDVLARLAAFIGLAGSQASFLAERTLLPPLAVLITLPALALMLVTESWVFRLREQLGLRVRGRRLWALTSERERAALHDAGLRRYELAHRAGTIVSWVVVGAVITLGLIGLLSL